MNTRDVKKEESKVEERVHCWVWEAGLMCYGKAYKCVTHEEAIQQWLERHPRPHPSRGPSGV